MRFLIFGIAVWMTLDATDSLAQTTAVPPPKVPVLHRVPAMASWTIQFKNKTADRAAPKQSQPISPNQIQCLTVTKTNSTYREQTVLASGQKDEKWILDGSQLKTVNNGKVIILIAPPTATDPSPEYSDYSKSDFEGLGWVSLNTYKGVGARDGQPVYLFEGKESGEKLTAILAVDTQLPLYSSAGDVSCTYTFNSPPAAPLVPPKRFLDILETHKRGLEAMKYHPSLP